MTWKLNNTELTEIPTGAIGFVYMITHIESGRRYIGKKSFFASHTRTRTVVVKSTGLKKKKKIRSQIESDWKTYFGSSDYLKSDVEKYGENAFDRTILKLCYNKGELSYFEAKYQFDYDVLLDPALWYNSWISVRVQRSHLKHLIKS
jgi:hypothetical protein